MAKAIWEEEHPEAGNAVISRSELVGKDKYFAKMPECPEGGIYTIGRVGELPQCSIPMHSLAFGNVEVSDSSGKPLTNAVVVLSLPGKPARRCATDLEGLAFLTTFRATEGTAWGNGIISVNCEGYVSESVAMPTAWPLKLFLKRQ
jgi:hypothetical protein